MRLAWVVAVAVVVLCSGVAASVTAAATRTFGCTQTTSSRATQRQAVQGWLDAAGAPFNVVVTRPATGAIEISSPSPTLTPGYDGGYWKRTYHLNAWNLGTVSSGYPPKTLYLLLPDSTIGASFTALLKTDFLNSGNWQHWMACSAS